MLDPRGAASLGTNPALHDEELDRLERATPGPWNDAPAESFHHAPHKPPGRAATHRRASSRPGKFQPTSVVADATAEVTPLPAIPTVDMTTERRIYRLAKAPPRRTHDASSVVSAYEALCAETRAMEITRDQTSRRRHLHESALRMGLAQLSDDHIQAEKEIIRFNTIKNEVDIFQQYLDPFVFEMRTPREHRVQSSVYRHFMRMQAIQDMGIPIYSLGSYIEDPNDKILMPRTFQSFYRRIRRRNAADFTDVDLIPRPKPRRTSTVPKVKQETGETR